MMSVRLLQGENWRQLWEWGVLPWVRSLGPPSEKPDLLLLPHYAAVAHAKRRLAAAGIGALGLHVFTPGQMRNWLLARRYPDRKLIVREDLAFLLAAHAEALADDPLAASIALEPGPLLDDLDRLLAAGWTWQDWPDGVWKVIAGKALDSKNAAGWWTTGEADWKLRETSGKPLCRRLLAMGFTARNWPHWALLQAAVVSAEEATLPVPPLTDEPLGQLWQATWEETWNEVESLVPPPEEPPWPEPPVREGGFFRYAEKPVWFSTSDPMSEARAACGWVWSGAEHASHTRTKTLLFPPRSPVARAISLRLSEWSIPHHDTFGHQPACGPVEQQWKAWLHWQEHPVLERWLEWAEICREHAPDPAEIATWCERMKRAAQDLLHPDVAALQAWIRREPKKSAFGWMDQWPPLPEQEVATAYLRQGALALRQLGWEERADQLENEYAAIFATLERPVRRETFIAWLRERLRVPGRIRSGEGRETLASLQLLSYPEAEILPGGSFYCGGLTAGTWPPQIRETGVWPAAWIASKNDMAQQESRFGGGQKVLRPGYGYILGSADQLRLHRQGMAWILAEAGAACGATAPVVLSYAEKQDVLHGEVDGAGEFFLKSWHDWHDSLPTASDLEQMRREALLRAQLCLVFEKSQARSDPDDPLGVIAPCRAAWLARRDPTLPLDHYSFCFRAPAPPLATWSGRDWEHYWGQPAHAWLDRLLGLRPREESADLISPARWRARKLHAWTGWKESGQFLALPSLADWIGYSRECAGREYRILEEFWKSRGRSTPLVAARLWDETGEEARACLELLFELAGADFTRTYSLMASQPHTENSGQTEIPVNGQVDLVLAQKSSDPHDVRPWKALLLVDLSTGDPGYWNPRQVLDKGTGLRVVLPGLFYWKSLTQKLHAVILSADKAGDCKDLREFPEAEILARLAMARRGIFGPSEVMKSRFQFTGQYPLACLPIPPETVRAKRALSMAKPESLPF